ncbi:LOW QUALITY PROTEIN: hypothetical protein V1478_002333 [Vespula squamosa]|uniref:Uncharacterized protein n=1 Tax=Vespula squamosa TaxID=30214 RepID=A0ABD2BW08_VESSQ
MQPPTNHPPMISTYLIFNQLRIIHPQFRPKSRSSVLEPSQNFLSILTIVIEYSIVVVRARSKEEAVCRRGPHKLWLKRATIRLLSYFRRHDRSCLEMSEADGVDGGAFRKRGLTHLQWAEKPEAPEAERHLGTRISRVSVSPWVPECSNLLAVGPGSEILALCENLVGSKHDRSCLEMSEADGVDGGAFRKRGLTHLQWAEKPEAPEAERHLGTRISRVSVSPWVPECSNLLAVGPGSEILALYENLVGSNLALDFDECTSQFPRDAFHASSNEAGMQIGITRRPSDARADNKGGPLVDFDDYNFSFSLIFDECTSQLLRDAFPGSDNEGETQFRPKSRSSVLEPSQNFLSILTIVIEYSIVVVRARSKEEAVCRRGPHKLWLKRATIRLLSYFRRHDRSCLEMSEADGVDGGAFRKRGLTHLQWAEKPEAPEAERHLGTRISRVSVSPWVPECSNLLAVGPGSEILALCENLVGSKHDRSCLEMSEADGVDGGAFRKRGLTHLQWAEKPEAPEAERHLGTRISRVSVSPWVPECSNLLAVGPGSEILALYENLVGSKHDRSCLEMSEADGVDGGAFRKRGLTHLQLAEKPEAPEAEWHLGTRILELDNGEINNRGIEHQGTDHREIY